MNLTLAQTHLDPAPLASPARIYTVQQYAADVFVCRPNGTPIFRFEPSDLEAADKTAARLNDPQFHPAQ